MVFMTKYPPVFLKVLQNASVQYIANTNSVLIFNVLPINMQICTESLFCMLRTGTGNK